jgi:hypothetical protein
MHPEPCARRPDPLRQPSPLVDSMHLLLRAIHGEFFNLLVPRRYRLWKREVRAWAAGRPVWRLVACAAVWAVGRLV